MTVSPISSALSSYSAPGSHSLNLSTAMTVALVKEKTKGKHLYKDCLSCAKFLLVILISYCRYLPVWEHGDMFDSTIY